MSLKANAVLNMIRRGSAIVFPIITFSYASHKLGAGGIGAYSFSQTFVSYFLLLAALGISTYAVREGQAYRDNKEELETFVSEVYTINVLMTVISYVILGIFLLTWSKLENYQMIVLIHSIAIILTTVGADWINTLTEDYLFITIRYIVVHTICMIALIIVVKGPEDLYKYAVIGMLASAGGNLLNIVYVRKKVYFGLTRKPEIRKHIGPMVTLFSNSLAIKIYLLADVTILGIYMADQYVGYYTAASKVYTAIKEMINAMILVTVPRFSYYLARHEADKYEASYHKVINGVGTLIAPCVVGLIFQAKNILYYLGGKEYVAGTNALRILSIAMIFAVGGCLFSYSVLIPNKQEKFFLKATVASAVANIVLNILLIPILGIEAAALTTLVSEIMVCTATMIKGRNYLKSIIGLTKDMKAALIGCAVVAIVCLVLGKLIQAALPNMLVSVFLSIVAYICVTYGMHNDVTRHAIHNVKRFIQRIAA